MRLEHGEAHARQRVVAHDLVVGAVARHQAGRAVHVQVGDPGDHRLTCGSASFGRPACTAPRSGGSSSDVPAADRRLRPMRCTANPARIAPTPTPIATGVITSSASAAIPNRTRSGHAAGPSNHVAPDGFDVVRAADEEGVRAAVDHLVALGHREVVHVDAADAAMAPQRRAGFRAAMQRHGLAGRVLPGGYVEEDGARTARALLDGPLPTAVLAANDRCAVGLMDAFVRAGVRIPQDVSVVGYDDGDLARLTHIDLTTVNQDARAQARCAVAAALERLDDGRAEPTEQILSPRLVVRGTTAPPRAR